MILETLVTGIFQTNCYVVACEKSRQGVVIDPGDDFDAIIRAIEGKKIDLSHILLTHGHIDHIYSVAQLAERYTVPVAMNPDDRELAGHAGMQAELLGVKSPLPFDLDIELAHGTVLKIGSLEIVVLATPGHSPGSVCYYLRAHNIVFAGDTLFFNSIGRTDLPGGNQSLLLDSIKSRLFTLPECTRVMSGHGAFTTIGHEINTNPYLTAH